MKQFLILVAVITVLIPMILFFNDFSINNVYIDTVKRDADEAASAAALIFDEEKFSDGIWEFNDDEILRGFNELYKNKYHVTLVIYDFSKNFRKYDNTQAGEVIKKESENINLTESFIFDDGRKNVTIKKPCVLVILEGKGKGFRISQNQKHIVRSSMYEIGI